MAARRLLPPGWIALACLGAASGCTEPDPAEVVYAPYEGEAFPPRREPIAVPPGGMALVTDTLSDTISLVDLGQMERFGALPVGRDPVDVDGPHHLAVDVEQGFVYVALSYPVLGSLGPHAGHGGSKRHGYAQKLALDDLRILGEVRVDRDPGDIVLSRDGTRLVVSHFDRTLAVAHPEDPERARATIAVIDPATMELSGSPGPKRISTCIAPHGLVLSEPDGATAYVSCYGEDTIAVVDLSASEVLGRIPVGAAPGAPGSPAYGPYSVVRSPDGALLAVGNTASRDVRFFDVAALAMQPERVLPAPGAPFFAAFSRDGGRLFVPTQTPDALVVYDLDDGDVEIERRVFAPGECTRPHVVELHGEDGLLLVCEGDHVTPGRLLALDSTTLATRGAAVVGVYPDALVQLGGGSR